MPQIKLVLFDVGNVILRATHKITEAILWDLGVRPDRVALFFHGPAYGAFARGKITDEQFAQAVCETLEASQLTDAQIRAAHDAHIYMVDEAVMNVIYEIIKSRRVSLAFVTTTNVWQTAREMIFINLRGLGMVVRSHDIGMTKTDEGAWPVILKALNQNDRDPCAILFVDDAPANIAAAQAQLPGIQTHLYDPTPVMGVAKLREDLKRRGLFQ